MTPPHWNEVSRATCEQLLAAVDAAERGHPLPGVSGVAEVLRRARNEARPARRTRAAVDGEITRVVRERYRAGFYLGDLTELCAEPLAPEAANPVCSKCGAIHGPGNTNTLCPLASNYDKGLAQSRQDAEPDRCSCEEALALRERLASMVRICRGRAEQYSSGTITKAELEIVANELELALQ